MKKIIIIAAIIIGLTIGWFVISRGENARNQSSLIESLDTFTVERGTLSQTVGAKGSIHSNQSANLYWEIPGQVEKVNVTQGMQVSAGDVLATLKTTSLPANIILAQSDLVSSQKALEDLFHSQSKQAAALKALDDAQKALEDALNPENIQAQVLVELANSQVAVDTAQQQFDILTAPVPQSALDQSYANLLLAEDKLLATRDTIAKIERQFMYGAAGIPTFLPDEFKVQVRTEIRRALRKALDGLQIQLTQDQLSYEKSLNRYNQLLSPPDPIDVGVAKANLAAANSQLVEAKREWDRVKNGPSAADIAVHEAILADAHREWERLKDGPDPEDITLLEAQIAASKAALRQTKVTAPFDGVITMVETQMGDLVNPDTLAFRIDDISHLMVDLMISEIDIYLVKDGQDVVLTFDSVLAKEYHGEVVEVAMVGTELLGGISFNVVIELLDFDEDIRMGMISDINIVIRQKRDVLLIPSRAIQVLNGDKVVYVKGGGNPRIEDQNLMDWLQNLFGRLTIKMDGVHPVRIELGESANFTSEVIAGDLKPGDQVFIDPPEEITNIPERQNSSGFIFEHP